MNTKLKHVQNKMLDKKKNQQTKHLDLHVFVEKENSETLI
jgi:hypothetical protein